MTHDDKWYPDALPGHWKLPAPPVCTRQWSGRDWVLYAAPYNAMSLELMRIERDHTSTERRDTALFLRGEGRA